MRECLPQTSECHRGRPKIAVYRNSYSTCSPQNKASPHLSKRSPFQLGKECLHVKMTWFYVSLGKPVSIHHVNGTLSVYAGRRK